MRSPYSPHETIATILIDDHYARLGLDKGWDKRRLFRLCQMLKVTPHELGKLCLVRFSDMNRFIKQNYIPPHVALHFAIIESWYMDTVLGVKKSEPIMPIDILAEHSSTEEHAPCQSTSTS